MQGATMDQITVRGFDKQLASVIRRLANQEHISLNKAVLRLLRKGAGIETRPEIDSTIGHSLDRFVGSWSESQAEEFDESVQVFNKIDADVWE